MNIHGHTAHEDTYLPRWGEGGYLFMNTVTKYTYTCYRLVLYRRKTSTRTEQEEIKERNIQLCIK